MRRARYYMGWHCRACGRRVHNPRRTPPRCCGRVMINDVEQWDNPRDAAHVSPKPAPKILR